GFSDASHALPGSKRGAHLGLSPERLEALPAEPPVRIGVSATTKPLERVAEFLVGAGRGPAEIVDVGHVRERDLELELPSAPLEPIMPNEVWTEIYDKLADLIRAHRTTLPFVCTLRPCMRTARPFALRQCATHRYR